MGDDAPDTRPTGDGIAAPPSDGPRDPEAPGGRTDTATSDADASDGEGELCDACPENDDGLAVDPSIFRPFWKDARAELKRRDYAKVLATVGGITAVGSLAAPVAGLTRVFERKYQGPVYEEGIPLVDDAGERIGEDRIAPGEQLTVFPEPRPGIEDAPTLLVRFEESAYGDQVRDEYTVGGYAAFSKVCTHAGCMVDDRDGDVLVHCKAGVSRSAAVLATAIAAADDRSFHDALDDVHSARPVATPNPALVESAVTYLAATRDPPRTSDTDR